jgi:hypothetical protein
VIAEFCDLPQILNEATRAFLAVLDGQTLADMLRKRGQLSAALNAGRTTPHLSRPRKRASQASVRAALAS